MHIAERSITKVLSANDTGETGGHQAGILVPKEERLLSFFPELVKSKYNPRSHLIFTDKSGAEWEFAFIYYNNSLFGGTRNEYRLTRMTRFIREAGLVTGDEVILSRSADGSYLVDFRRKSEAKQDERGVLKLGSGWKVIEI
ncbi:EcoRII N-terminal effector-binding domain-containing protein [Nitratireductor sp. XY-223]|uniref:EcoRII N-terminal effector-binding domain-containing protein n=1 Tax=Nitratireductor sp. XY-223 TaxID=2561926 RepID=UPI00197DA4A0|nr:EcoRII N-terminal effector-binding domain-containing protein [Nitratireductor sp. XY-223]